MSQHYKQAIDILMRAPEKFCDVAVALAKHNPKLFCKLNEDSALTRAIKSASNETCAEILNEIKEGRKVNAIKRVRAYAGLGLKEAKDIVDAAAVTGELDLEAHV